MKLEFNNYNRRNLILDATFTFAKLGVYFVLLYHTLEL